MKTTVVLFVINQSINQSYLCLTVEPAARGATVLLGERLEAPTFVALAACPGYKYKQKNQVNIVIALAF